MQVNFPFEKSMFSPSVEAIRTSPLAETTRGINEFFLTKAYWS